MFTMHQNKAMKWLFNDQESRRDAQWPITVVVLYVRNGKKNEGSSKSRLRNDQDTLYPF